jgi:hypothetical protein
MGDNNNEFDLSSTQEAALLAAVEEVDPLDVAGAANRAPALSFSSRQSGAPQSATTTFWTPDVATEYFKFLRYAPLPPCPPSLGQSS